MLKEKRDLLNAKKEARQAIYSKVVAENRSRTPEETTQYDALGVEISALETEVRFLEIGEAENRANSTIAIPGQAGVHTGVAGNTHSSDGEQRDLGKFSLGRVIKRMRNNQPIEGIDAEVIQEGQNEARQHGLSPEGNLVLPYGKFALNKEGRDLIRESVERRDLSATGQTSVAGDQGGATIQTSVGQLYQALFNAIVLRGMGAMFMPNMVGNLNVPRVIKAASPGWKAENADADEVSPTINVTALSPKRLPAYIEVSNQLFLQSEANISQVLENYLVQELSSIYDAAAINGAGPGSNMPLGILNTAGIGTVYAGGASAAGTNADGAALTWKDVVNLYSKISISNANFGKLGYLLNPQTVGALQVTPKSANTAAVFVLGEGAATLNAFNVGITNNVPSTLTKGASTGILSAMAFGNFNDLWMAMWGGLDLLVNPYSLDKSGMTRINAALYADSAVVRPESFAAIKDANPALAPA